MHYFGVKTLSETLFPPPLMKAGYGTRKKAEFEAAAVEDAAVKEDVLCWNSKTPAAS